MRIEPSQSIKHDVRSFKLTLIHLTHQQGLAQANIVYTKMKVFIVAVVLAVALTGAECGLISTIMENIPFLGKTDNSTTTARPITSNATSAIPAPCVPEETLSPTLQLLHDRLPPQFGELVTPDNVETLKNVGTLAGLATSAATGNPIAIINLIKFIASPENPIGPLYEMGKQIAPLLKPADLTGSLKNATSSATNAITTEFQEFQQNLMNILHKTPTQQPQVVTASP